MFDWQGSIVVARGCTNAVPFAKLIKFRYGNIDLPVCTICL